MTPEADHERLLAHEGPVLILEFVNADQFPGRINYLFPVVAGYFVARGCPTRWLRFAISTTNMMEHGRDSITLSDEEAALLLQVAAEHRPSLLVVTDPLYEPQLQAACEAAGDPWIVVSDGDPETDLIAKYDPSMMVPTVTKMIQEPGMLPRYDWEPGNEAARQREMDNIYLLFADSCGHVLSIEKNPLYCGITDDRTRERRGCAFCTSSQLVLPSTAEGAAWKGIVAPAGQGDSTRVWVARQIEGMAKTRDTPERFPHAILFEQLASDSVLEQTINSLHEHGLQDHVQLLFAIRTDQVPRFRARLHRHFAERPDSGLVFGVYATGIESLSASELGLYNKGTTPLDGIRAVNALRELTDCYPENFWYTGLSFLMHTPWTRLETLHLNYGLIRFLGLSRKVSGNMFMSRLRMHPHLPITALAEAEGLRVEEESDPTVIMNRRKLFGSEMAWRFKDPRMRPVSRIVLRFDLLEEEPLDPLGQKLKDNLLELNPEWTPGEDDDLLDFVCCLAEVACASEEVVEEEALLGEALDLLRRRRGEEAAPPEPARYRVGSEKLELTGLVGRLEPLLSHGEKPIVSVSGVRAGDLAPGLTQLLARHGLEARLAEPPAADGEETGAGVLFVGRDPEAVARRAELQAEIAGWTKTADAVEAFVEAARLEGWPECCARAGAERHGASLPVTPWAAMGFRAQADCPLPRQLNPVLVPSLALLPCAPDCAEAAATYARWLGAVEGLPAALDEDTAFVFSLDGEGDGDLAALKVLEDGEDGIRYTSVEGGDDAGGLGERLRRGDELQVAAGQLRVCSGGHVVDFVTATHGLWYHGRAWRSAEWCELARAASAGTRARWRELGRSAAAAGPFPEKDDEPSRGVEAGADATSGTERERKWLQLVEAVIARFERRFAEVSVLRVQEEPEPGTLGLRLAVADTEYELRLHNRRSGTRHVFASDHFVATHLEETPLSTPEHVQILRDLVRAADKTAARYAPELLPGD